MSFCLPDETFKTAFHLLFRPGRLESSLGGLSFLEKGSATLKSPASCQAAKHSFCVQYEQWGNAFQHCVSWSWVNSIVPAVFTHGKLIGC